MGEGWARAAGFLERKEMEGRKEVDSQEGVELTARCKQKPQNTNQNLHS